MEYYFNFKRYSDVMKVDHRRSLHFDLGTYIQDERKSRKKMKRKLQLSDIDGSLQKD